MPPSPPGEGFTRSPLRWTRKRDEFRSQVLPLEGKVSPQATEEVSYRKAVSFDGRKSGTKITSSVIRLAGDAGCHPPLKGRDFYAQSAPTDAEAERSTPLPSSGLRETPDATLPSRGGIFTRSPFRRTRKRDENHLFRHPACGGRRMPPSPQGEGFCAQLVSTDAKPRIEKKPKYPIPFLGALCYNSMKQSNPIARRNPLWTIRLTGTTARRSLCTRPI